MTSSDGSLNLRLDPQLELFVEQAMARLQRGEQVDIADIVKEQTDFAAPLRELLPAIAALVKLGPGHPEPNPDSLHAAPPFAQLGDFRLIRQIGRGGMGSVFEAEQLPMGRRVALKVLPFAALADEKSLQRFRNEVRAAAALDHPHIVPVYSVGEERGVHFYAMRLIHGQSLAEAIEQMRREGRGTKSVGGQRDQLEDASPGSLSSTAPPPQPHSTPRASSDRRSVRFQTISRLGIDAAEALQHAHDQGVLHRDIKPGNLLLDSAGQVYVADFGLARIVAEAGLTHTGDMISTLRYMAPEQASGRRVVIDHRADIYSLGATLYELLTLHPVHPADDRVELLRQIATFEPSPLRRFDPKIPGDLETIVLKALAKEPDQRYATSQELADDLQRYLAHQPITARRPTLYDRARKLSRRHAQVFTWAGLVLVLLTTLLATSVILINRARTRALTALAETSDLLYMADMSQAYEAWDKGWSAEAQVILDRHRARKEGTGPAGLEWQVLNTAVR